MIVKAQDLKPKNRLLSFFDSQGVERRYKGIVPEAMPGYLIEAVSIKIDEDGERSVQVIALQPIRLTFGMEDFVTGHENDEPDCGTLD